MLTQIHMQSKVWVTGPLAISTAEKIFANVPRGLVARPMPRIAPRRSEKLYLIVALAIRFAIAAISQNPWAIARGRRIPRRDDCRSF